jgi:hypothetical protein
MGRTADRAGYDHQVRLSLVEKDIDQVEEGMSGLRAEIAATRQVLIGILIAVTTASILLAVNLVVKT